MVGLTPADSIKGAGMGLAVRTLADGAFEIVYIVPGRYALDISARGFNPTRSILYFAAGQDRSGYRYSLTPAAVCPKVAAGRKNPACP